MALSVLDLFWWESDLVLPHRGTMRAARLFVAGLADDALLDLRDARPLPALGSLGPPAGPRLGQAVILGLIG
ncbi:hypothetical protein QJS66_15000 [Kocuria rhizophila]|nr:hypothetical protein QJS66_15000 [Kocuria rhizophila]